MKRYLLTLSFILLSLHLFASHIAGGEIRYEFNGANYTVYLTILGDCVTTSAPLGGTFPLNFSSVSTGKSFTRQFALSSLDYPNQSCISNPCSPNSWLPGYGIGIAVDTVSLPPASDWVIGLGAGAARSIPVNLQSQSSNIYIEATLNNSSASNSTPKLPYWSTVYIATFSPVYFPLGAIDADGDSIVYELVDPMIAPSTNDQYNGNYSSNNPLGPGSTYKLTNDKRNIEMMALLQGSHALAIKIKEYRNNTMIGSYMREFTVSPASTFTSQQTIPLAASSSVFDIYTCPGQNNNITVNFLDSTAADSVYVAAHPPVLNGWTFNTTTSAAPGVGSATISWITPASADPNTLKQFTIKIRAQDNTCPIRSIMDYYVTVKLQSCSADSVWPGDANGDNTVNSYDPLYIAIANGKTGAARSGAVSTWTPQFCAPWGNSFLTNNTNIKHADCDGNGIVNSNDLWAVANNYGHFHLKSTADHAKTTGAPELYFDLAGVVLLPGANASIPIRTGNSINAVNRLYGLATRIRIDGLNLTTAPSVATASSWLGSNTLNFTYPVSNTTVDWAHARIDQQEVTGHGIVGTLNFTVPTSAQQGKDVDLFFELPKLIDKDGLDLTFNAVNASLKVGFPDHVDDAALQTRTLIVPNPSGNTASLYLSSDKTGMVDVSITNIMGQQVSVRRYNIVAGDHRFVLPADLVPGLYFVHINNQAFSQNIKWTKQQ